MTKCVCCGKPMKSDEQRFPSTTLTLVTCVDKACKMYGFTFSTKSYPPANLSDYMNRGKTNDR